MKRCLKFLSTKVWDVRQARNASTDLKEVFAEILPKELEKMKNFRKKHGSTKIGEVTVEMLYSGMRGISAMIYETSVLDINEGIRFRDYTIPEVQSKLPKVPGGHEPQPEGIFWLLLTGQIPTKEQVDWVSQEWIQRAELPPHVCNLLNNLPAQKVHPMTQFAAAITASNTESCFEKAWHRGEKKSKYWEFVYEDSMNLIAKLPGIAAIIYRNTYHDGKVCPIQNDKDWSENFTTMMGFDSAEFTDLMRLYLTIHSDHEGGNVSAHATHLVASSLADPYIAFASGVNGLAGPLHGLANQESLIFIKDVFKEVGDNPTEDKISEACKKLLKAGRVIPGYGHAVLRKTDPRFICFVEFGKRHFPDDPVYKLLLQLSRVVPKILGESGKVKNPWPNVDCGSGVMLNHYGLKEMSFYTVCFGVSRALGALSSLIWARAYGLPIERPKSFATDTLIKKLGGQ